VGERFRFNWRLPSGKREKGGPWRTVVLLSIGHPERWVCMTHQWGAHSRLVPPSRRPLGVVVACWVGWLGSLMVTGQESHGQGAPGSLGVLPKRSRPWRGRPPV